MEPKILAMIATVVETCAGAARSRRGRPAAGTVRVLTTLRRFLREGTPWQSLKATPTEASGSTLRRRLAAWASIDLLQRVHAVLVAMLRGDPDLILDSCSVRAKRGGDPTGPNPTDRGKRGTKHHVAVTGEGVTVACAASHGRQRQRYAPVRAPVPDGVRRRGPDRDRVRGQRLRRRSQP